MPKIYLQKSKKRSGSCLIAKYSRIKSFQVFAGIPRDQKRNCWIPNGRQSFGWITLVEKLYSGVIHCFNANLAGGNSSLRVSRIVIAWGNLICGSGVCYLSDMTYLGASTPFTNF